LQLPDGFLPFCIFNPVGNLHLVLAYIVLKFFAASSVMFC
jgi:nicotinic acid mononucleotide adenylyltransferase